MTAYETRDKNETIALKERLRNRPIWQRVIYPIVGIILIVLGLIGWLVPIIPGFPLIIIGLPLVACFHPRIEMWVRMQMYKIGRAIVKNFKK